MKTPSKQNLCIASLFLVGVTVAAISQAKVASQGALSYEPNPAALQRSPYGRTIGMALQGPVNRFWDRGIGGVEESFELEEVSSPHQKLFNHIAKMQQGKAETQGLFSRSKKYQKHAMGKVEEKLSLAWRFDPRNFGNYAIYQTFLWEDFSGEAYTAEMTARELSMKTLALSLQDERSPTSLLTAAQASYDIVFDARLDKKMSPEQRAQYIAEYGESLQNVIRRYELLVAEMKADGSWQEFSPVKIEEFEQRKIYLDHLSRETEKVTQELASNQSYKTGGNNL